MELTVEQRLIEQYKPILQIQVKVSSIFLFSVSSSAHGIIFNLFYFCIILCRLTRPLVCQNMDGSRKQIQGTGRQMLLSKTPHEDDKYSHVEYFSIYRNSGDPLGKYFGSLKIIVKTTLYSMSDVPCILFIQN